VNSPACLAEKAQCENKEIVVVKDSAEKCPAAKSVCTATGESNPACIAAKEECVATLQELYKGAKHHDGDERHGHHGHHDGEGEHEHHGHHDGEGEHEHHGHDEEEPDYMQELYKRAGHKSDHCMASTMVCTAAGETSDACIAEKKACEDQKAEAAMQELYGF